jgi:hypothetical protein
MSAYGLQLDAWLDDKLCAVPIPNGLTARLRRIPGLVTDGEVCPPEADFAVGSTVGVVIEPTLSPLTTPPLCTPALDAALAAVPLPNGLIVRLQTTCGPAARGARRRDRMERTAVAAVLLLAIGGSYAASLAAFLWTSYPAARLAAAAELPRWFQGTYSSTEDIEGPTVRFGVASADSPATKRVFYEAVAAAYMVETAPEWETGATDGVSTLEPLLLASGDVNIAISEHLDRLWQQGHGIHGGQVLMSRVGTSETDNGFEAMKEYLSRWFAGRLAEWPCLRELAGVLDSLREPTDERSERED